ncbi:GtrA family protein [Streptococcus halichoeri]|uniref:GtrA family protein n=1 Tax=Streptococcus halichoeri TaxID=254785 RepID=UPI0019179B53|nr:GtrA family protein [Streptococcus halichoeri]
MLIHFKKILHHELVLYLIFGILTTLVYILSRLFLFWLIGQATLSATLANIIAILFAFVTNDTLVFKQVSTGWLARLIKFGLARLVTLALDVAMAYLLVERFPGLIGQFVENDVTRINGIETLIGQVVVIVVNYILSKWFVFRNTQ